MTPAPPLPPDPQKRMRRTFDPTLGLIFILAILVLVFGLGRVVKYVSGEKQGGTSQSVVGDITILDGDTIRSGDIVFRLIGFDAPERGDRALCDRERELAEATAARLSALVANGEPKLERVACPCPAGTEGSQACNFGRACAFLRVNGQDVGETLIRERLAHPFSCGATNCPPRQPWC